MIALTHASTPGPSRLRTVWRALRPPFLLLTLVCVALGVALVHGAGARLVTVDALWVLLGALAAHGAVNLLNEYHDARSGLDQHTRRTPFSGGSGALQDDPAGLGAVRAAAWALLVVTLLVGAWALTRGGALLLPIGAVGVALVLSYTPALNRHPWLCLAAPGLGIGVLVVLGTVVVLAGGLDARTLLVALIAGLLGSALLLANQFPDIEADRRVGRRHLAISHGRAAARRVYAVLALLAALALLGGIQLGLLPGSACLALPALASMAYTWRGLGLPDADAAQLTPYLAANVAAVLLAPLALAVTLW
ncbi:MAG: prenyltransferase [Gammaproteobacteria bacterium]